jgi:general secretion pathway protein B
MSSILKALKKLEQEKELRRGGIADIARGISRAVPRSRAKPRWLIPVAVAGVALAASLTTFALMSVFPRNARKSVSATGQHEQFNPPVVMAPRVSAPSTRGSEVLPRKAERSAAVASQPGFAGKGRVYGKPSRAEVSPKGFIAGEARQKTALSGISPSQKKLPEPVGAAGQLSKPSSGPAMPVLTLTGIAWQKDSADRVAVVNGISVTEGVVVEGARVEEIFQDRVRFSFEKQTFDVTLGRTNQGK